VSGDTAQAHANPPVAAQNAGERQAVLAVAKNDCAQFSLRSFNELVEAFEINMTS
jgi:hypothetical protein